MGNQPTRPETHLERLEREDARARAWLAKNKPESLAFYGNPELDLARGTTRQPDYTSAMAPRRQQSLQEIQTTFDTRKWREFPPGSNNYSYDSWPIDQYKDARTRAYLYAMRHSETTSGWSDGTMDWTKEGLEDSV